MGSRRGEIEGGVFAIDRRERNMMDPKLKRKNLRLKGFDYSLDGFYFVTICTRDRTCLFGNVVGGSMRLNNFGEIIKSQWSQLERKYPDVKLNHFIIMPNHVHGIIVMTNAGAGSPRPDGRGLGAGTAPLQRLTLGHVIAYFKYQSTKQINVVRGIPGMSVWQRNYYERIIRDENDLGRVRQYITNNPILWDSDPDNVNNIKKT